MVNDHWSSYLFSLCLSKLSISHSPIGAECPITSLESQLSAVIEITSFSKLCLEYLCRGNIRNAYIDNDKCVPRIMEIRGGWIGGRMIK